jgi:mono/diheme cytochrome c family protein
MPPLIFAERISPASSYRMLYADGESLQLSDRFQPSFPPMKPTIPCRLSLLALAFVSPMLRAEPTPTTGPLGQVAALSPQEELKTIHLPEGYKLELVLDDSQIKEPVLCVFDGNGRMYVAEMRSYMQDIDGKDELTPTSRVSRHESSKGDGVFDQHSVYLDKQLLPRMVLPIDDRVLVGVTNTSDLTLHRDSNGDGTSDTSSVWFAGGPRGGNLEHQPSGLVWGLDNWIYTTYNGYRLRWNGSAAPLQESIPGNGGQWGLAQDDFGKMWWSNAGGEKGLWNFQVPILYGAINAPSQKPADFDNVWPLVALGDFQGGPKRFQSPENKALNHFTGSCGHTIFRGDRLPADMRGNVFLPEPVGRLIRRATVKVEDGVTKLANPYGQSEFIRSTDPNFRPMNMTTGPDGCLYIVDMYRGIIQEGNWTREGSFLRERIKENGMQNVVGHGRIWRLVHKDFKPGPQPKMLDETPAQLVQHLTHPNGWWRDTAQRMLIVKGDKSVVPALIRMAANDSNPLARIHALWTLEGLNALSPEMINSALSDSNPQIRAQGIRAAESILKGSGNHGDLATGIEVLASDPDPTVQLQVIMTRKLLKWPDWKSKAQAVIATSSSAGIREIGSKLLAESPKLAAGDFSKEQKASLARGQEIFSSVCFACHGFDGKGMPMAGNANVTLAPPLAGSKTVKRADSLQRVLLHGLAGPIEGKTYESQMMTMASNSDEWIADITNYVRNSFGNQGPLVTTAEIKKLRADTAKRTTPWTIAELEALSPQPVETKSTWVLTSSLNESELSKGCDGDATSRWTTKKEQSPGDWVSVKLPAPELIQGIVLDSGTSRNDYPRAYKVELSKDGKTWDPPIIEGKGSSALTEIQFPSPVTTSYLRITQTGSAPGKYWSIHELKLLAPAKAR